MEQQPTISTLRLATDRIKAHIHRTPVLTSESLNRMFGASLFFKCENFQRGGSFKIRGATNAVFSFSDEVIKKGVATHSSGNHAQAVAIAAALRGVPSYIVMPGNSPGVKKRATESYGGKIIFCESSLESREKTLAEVVEETGACFVHPYDDYKVIAGQATVAMEFYEEMRDMHTLLCPVGGGGLLSGSCLGTSYLSPLTEVVGVEPVGADDAQRSLEENKIMRNSDPQTIADGLKANLSEKTFTIISSRVKEIVTVSDSSIIEAMKLIGERLKIVVEPSGAVPLAALLEKKIDFSKKRIGIILSGGNIDLTEFSWK